jgi:hypothetical protein
MAAATKKRRKKEQAYPWKASASSGHTTNHKQSILETFDIYGLDLIVNLKKNFLIILAKGQTL